MAACANKTHHFCAAECFPAYVVSQVHITITSINLYTESRRLQIRGGEEKMSFRLAGYNIICKDCPPAIRKPFDMQQLASK